MKKSSKIILAILTVFVISFSGGKVYAEDEGKIDNIQSWETTRTFGEIVSRALGENIFQLVLKWGEASFQGIAALITPGSLVIGDDLVKSDLPDSLKYGLVGIAEDQLVAIYQNYPNPNIGEHLAQEWVPGYSTSSSTFANGYEDLQSTNITQFWNKTRNLAYILYVVIFIIIGFMIMFRHKLGGQTMVTLGNSLPNIIISLLLVTFSFAIAGLIIDIGGMVLNVIANLIYGGNAADAAIAIHTPASLGLGGIFSKIADIWQGDIFGLSGITGSIVGKLSLTAGGPIALLIVIIVGGFTLWGAIKLWFSLVKTYLVILVNVIVAPLQIMTGALPGNSAAIGNWLKSMIRNVLVFPVAFAIVNLPNAIALGMEESAQWTGFPDALVWGDASNGIATLGPIILSLLKLFGIYFAASTPEYMKALIPSTQSKAMAEFVGAVKGGLGKVPFVGGMFK